MKPFVFDIDIAPEAAFSALQGRPYALWLDSADTGHPGGRYSFIAANPLEMIEAKDGRVTITNADCQTTIRGEAFKIAQERLQAWNICDESVPGLPPFQGGLAGFFGYDLARGIEKLPQMAQLNPHMPDMAAGIYDVVMAFDHKDGKAWMIVHAPNYQAAERKRAYLSHIFKTEKSELRENVPVKWNAPDSAEEYRAKIQKVIDYILAGDIFQANLSRRFEAVLPPSFSRFSQYMNMRAVNPAPYAAYMNLGHITIASSSPEQFLHVDYGQVTTRPIKGTRARGATKAEDDTQRKALSQSMKDRAENIMIVDLLRNDLSKVCEPRSVNLLDLCKLETFAGVHHLVSTIEGKLEGTPFDLLRACFPGGSITGAPKIRAMEIIEELEPVRRGPYCGSMAYVGFNGAMDSNILIRTLVYEGNKVSLQVGGGITAESNVDEEYAETLVKADKIFRSFEPVTHGTQGAKKRA